MLEYSCKMGSDPASLLMKWKEEGYQEVFSSVKNKVNGK